MARGPDIDPGRLALNRRRFIGCLSAAGLGSTLLPGTLTAVAQDAETITVEMLDAAARTAGLSLTPDELTAVAEGLNGDQSFLDSYDAVRDLELPNAVPPAFVFN
ncbi:MAG TPA: hypothetical protein QGH10_14745, partial [Armatimonadota bacterium]|nr:hypothetical protein [Armatimonadota bacterium]